MRLFVVFFACLLVFPVAAFCLSGPAAEVAKDTPTERAREFVLEDGFYTVRKGDSLSKIWLAVNGCDAKRMRAAMMALEGLGEEQLRAFGIDSGDVDLIRPQDRINISAIQKWLEGGDAQADADTAGEEVPAQQTPAPKTEESAADAATQEEGEEDSQDADSPIDKEEHEESSDDSPSESPLSPEAETSDHTDTEQESTDQTEQTDQDPRSDEPDLVDEIDLESKMWSLTLGYADHGVDAILPEHFFRGHIFSQKVSVSHANGFFYGVENFISPADGFLSDKGDRTTLFAGLRKSSESFHFLLQHRWVHNWERYLEDFYHADRHRTSVQLGYTVGPLHLYALASSDMAAYRPVNEFAVYGGVGGDLRFTAEQLNTTEMYVGASIIESLYLYNQPGRALYRVRAGLSTSIDDLFTVNPEILFLRGVYTPDSLLTMNVRISF